MDYVIASHLPSPPPSEKSDLAGLEQLPPQRAYGRALAKLRAHVGASLSHQFDLTEKASQLTPSLKGALKKLGALRGKTLQWMPQNIWLKLIPKTGEPLWFSVINNSAHKNVAQIFLEDRRRVPDEDSLTLVPGFLGSYPNAIWSVKESQLPDITHVIASLANDSDYSHLLDQFGVRRTDANFWSVSDEAHRVMRQQQGVNFGLGDYNRLENR